MWERAILQADIDNPQSHTGYLISFNLSFIVQMSPVTALTRLLRAEIYLKYEMIGQVSYNVHTSVKQLDEVKGVLVSGRQRLKLRVRKVGCIVTAALTSFSLWRKHRT